jgi:hypothetical protein
MLCLYLPCISPFAQRFNAHIYFTKDIAPCHTTHRQFRVRFSHCLLRALRESSFASGFASIESSSEGELSGNTFNAVSRVYVLDQRDLVASCGALTRDDSGVGKEEFPDLCIISLSTTQQNKWPLTLYHLLPYFAKTFSELAIQFLYHLQRVAE